MEYRVPSICSHIYRRWASLRLASMDTWFAQFSDASLYGGVPGRSAADASWGHALLLEEAKVAQEGVSTLVVDIHKCFDQVNRSVVAQLALRQGAPPQVVTAWSGFLEQLVTLNCLASS
eukprot:9050442-Alexandrium_andersonii.AAC.1